MKQLFFLLFLTMFFNVSAQFPGAVGTIGSTAIHKDSSVFVNWASSCTVMVGYQDISNTTLGYTTVGDSTMALGMAGTNGVVSLGDGGTAILTFPNPITNGEGFDFAVFENGFSDDFLELAFVEVSSDGVNYVRFPATSNTQTQTQIGPFDNTGDATKLNNLAGKYRVNYGTPFDLEELKNESGLDVNSITHVRIRDVVGSLNPLYATYDMNNNPVNDPFPTAFASGGFDLDAVGVIHQSLFNQVDETGASLQVNIFPNPTSDFISINLNQNELIDLTILNLSGQIVLQTTHTSVSLIDIPTGIYFLKITTGKGQVITKKIMKQ